MAERSSSNGKVEGSIPSVWIHFWIFGLKFIQPSTSIFFCDIIYRVIKNAIPILESLKKYIEDKIFKSNLKNIFCLVKHELLKHIILIWDFASFNKTPFLYFIKQTSRADRYRRYSKLIQTDIVHKKNWYSFGLKKK